MPDADQDVFERRIQFERHIQTIGLAVITVMLGFMWANLDDVRVNQNNSAINIRGLETALGSIERTQSSLSERLDELARDRFTGAEARVLQSTLSSALAEIRAEARAEIQANDARIRRIEALIANYHGTNPRLE